MKFSDEIVMGSALIHFTPEVFLDETCGCLIGMAAAARGETNLQKGGSSLVRIGTLWPWLEKPRVVACPECDQEYRDYTTVISCVAHHVKSGDMTFDQALSYIRSIEPPDEVRAPEETVPVWNRYRAVAV